MNTTLALIRYLVSPMSYIEQFLMMKSLALCHQLRRVWTSTESVEDFASLLFGMGDY